MLDGIRIIEFEALGPAPFAGMLLADLGAEVIVVHRPDGGLAPGLPERNLLDRGKRSITLDLKAASDMATARALIRSADGLTEGLRPGVMERLGLGPEDARHLNPALVYGRMTGWGQDGPRAPQAGLFATQPQSHWAAVFAGSDACVAPVLTPEEAQTDPHIAARAIWDGGVPAAAPRFDGRIAAHHAIPSRGEDSAAILKDLKDRGLL